MKGRPLVVVLSVAMLLLSFADHAKGESTKPLEKINFKVSWHHGVQFLGYYVAVENNYYAEEGLKVHINPLSTALDSSKVPYMVVAGEFDFGTSNLVVVEAQLSGEPLVVLAGIYQFSPQVVFAKADAGIRSLQDIAGRTVGIKNTTWRKMIEELLALEDISMEDVKEVQVGFDMTPFYEGKVDVWGGFVTNEVTRARMKGYQLVTFPFYEYGFLFLTNSIYTSQEYLKSHPAQVLKFLRASLKGWNWAIENPAEAVDIFLNIFPEKAEDRDFHLASFNASIPLIRPHGVRVGSIDCEKYLSEIDLKQKSLKEFCDTSYLEKVFGEIR
jgi:ABC-type nitrate/sulfonate/bicarbonate transport system substrate-binding protein